MRIVRLGLSTLAAIWCSPLRAADRRIEVIEVEKFFYLHDTGTKLCTFGAPMTGMVLDADCMYFNRAKQLGPVAGIDDEASRDRAKLLMGVVQQSLQMFRIHNNRYPTTAQGLKVLIETTGEKSWRGPYIETSKLRDPWGMALQYQSDGKNFQLKAAGPDKRFGSEDDVTYPD